MKYRSILELKNKISELKKYENVIVFTNGCFDILHKGHITYLSEARELGDYLIVGLNSDRSVTQIKGPERPISNQYFRSEKLLELNSVDDVIIFDEDTPQNLINELQPNILVKGGGFTLSLPPPVASQGSSRRS